jgi:DNA-binding NarL/FixJ family response regulator
MDNKIRVMLADDHMVVRQGLSALIEGQSDMEIVGEAADGVEAVNLARRCSPDVILMDINMPKMNGLEATRIISAELPQTRIIGLSINDDPETIAAMQAAGAANHVGKDCGSRMLLTVIRKVAEA